MNKVADKLFLIIGAASETGKAICQKLLEDGRSVIATDLNDGRLTEAFPTTLPSNLKVIPWNIYDTSGIEGWVKEQVKTYGTFFGMVYCAGIGGVRPVSLTTTSFVGEMMHANFFTFLEFVRVLSKRGNLESGGSIVAISSVSSIRGLKSKTAYAASKAALDAAVRCLASELADKKIRVNSILKGWVSSDMKSDFIQNNMHLNKDNDFGKQLLGIIEPEELAEAVSFLMSDGAKSITGTALLIDGGYSL